MLEWVSEIASLSSSKPPSTGLPPRRDPLVLDLDGNGIQTVGTHSGHTILFDHDGDGIKNGTGWIAPNDGFSCSRPQWKRHDRQMVASCSVMQRPHRAIQQLATGFAALAEQDTNHDGVVDASDAGFNDLRVLARPNQDGISQSNELFTLSSLRHCVDQSRPYQQ